MADEPGIFLMNVDGSLPAATRFINHRPQAGAIAKFTRRRRAKPLAMAQPIVGAKQ
jgi:hypothetical protein